MAPNSGEGDNDCASAVASDTAPQREVPSLSLNPSALEPNSRIPTFTCASLERGQFEVDDDMKKLKLCKAPCRHNLKKCMHSYQSLPARTRQSLRILAIAVVLTLVLLAIFYLARIADQSNKYDQTLLVKEELQKNIQMNFGPDTIQELNPEQEYGIGKEEDGEEFVPGGRRVPLLKTFKDTQGKVRYVGKDKEMLDMAKKIIRTRPKGPAVVAKRPVTQKDINITLESVKRAVDLDRKRINKKELRFWEPGTEPLRIILVSTWRSGSTFLGQVLESHAGVYQHFEPLSHLGVRQVRSGKEAFASQQLIHRLLDCKYHGLDDYMNYTRNYPNEMLGHNIRIHNACNKGPNRLTCQNETFLSEACKLFPIQLVKTVRLRLNLTQLLLNDAKLRVKVLFLVRDPRGTMNSRYSSVTWCSSSPDCSSPDRLCQDLEGDLKVSAAFQKLYPNRFKQVKYEELAENPEEEILGILSFLGLEYTPETEHFIKDHTQSNQDKAWSITRKSKERINLWKKQLPLEEVHAVQNACGNVLKTLNYEFAGQ